MTKLNHSEMPWGDPEKSIQLYLLRDDAKILVDNELVTMKSVPTDVFIYLAVRQKAHYSRSDLIIDIYGEDTPDTRRTFSGYALNQVHPIIKERCYILKRGQSESFSFKVDDVWVDLLEFKQVVKQGNLFSEKNDFSYLQAVLEQYHAPMLREHRFKYRNLAEWHAILQREVETEWQRVCESVVRGWIKQDNINQAQQVVDLWYQKSTVRTARILQYRLWLDAKQDDASAFDQHVDILAQLEADDGPTQFGLSSEEWREVAPSKQTVSPLILDIDLIQRIGRPISSNQGPTELVGRENTLDRIRASIDAEKHKGILILGQSGFGKTALLTATMDSLQSRYHHLALVNITTNTTWFGLIDELIFKLDIAHLKQATYQTKLGELKVHFLNKPCLVVLDDYDNRVNWAPLLGPLTGILGCSTLIVASSNAPHHPDLDSIHLEPLTHDDILMWLVKSGLDVPRSDVSDIATQLWTFTGGYPIFVSIVIAYAKTQPSSLKDVMATLQMTIDRTETKHHDLQAYHQAIIQWIWKRPLSTNERMILLYIMLFKQHGLSVDMLGDMMQVAPNVIEEVFDNFEQLNLVQRIGNNHYVVYNSIRTYFEQLEDGLVKTAKEQFIKYLFNYLHEYKDTESPVYPLHKLIHLVVAYTLEEPILVERLSPEILIDLYPLFEHHSIYETMVVLFQQMLSFTQHDVPNQINILNILGKIYTKLGLLSQALATFEQAMAHVNTSGEYTFASGVLQNISVIYQQQGDYEQARHYLDQALEYTDVLSDPRLQQCKILGNQGSLATFLGDYEESKGCFEQALNLAHSLQDTTMIEFSQTGLGYSLSCLGDANEALRWYQKSLDILQGIELSERLVYVYLNFGVLYLDMDQYTDAETHFEEGLRIAEQIQHSQLKIHIRWNLGDLHIRRHQLLEAETLLKQCLLDAMDYNFLWLAQGIRISLGILYLRYNKWSMAQDLFFDVLTDESRSSEFAIKALYGFSLGIVASTHVVGPDNYQIIRGELMHQVPDPIKHHILNIVSTSIISLTQVEGFFQRYLSSYPKLHRYNLVRVLGLWEDA